MSTMKNGLYELYLKNGEIKPLLVDQHDNRQPCVIDEERLIFVSYHSKKESLFLLDLNTMKIEPFIVLEGYEFSPVISPNKQLLAFVHSEDTYEHDEQLYLYNMTTKAMKNLSGEYFGDYSRLFQLIQRRSFSLLIVKEANKRFLASTFHQGRSRKSHPFTELPTASQSLIILENGFTFQH